MKIMIVLVVIVALANQAMARTVPFSDSLVDHLDASETLSTRQLLAWFEEFDLDLIEDDLDNYVMSEYVADLLYATADKARTAVFNGVTVAKLIEQNTIQLTDCNLEGFKQRAELINSIEPTYQEEARTGVVYGLNVYALRCLHLATDYCLSNEELVIKQGVSDEKFMAGLMEAQIEDSQYPEPDETFDVDLVYNGIKSHVEYYIAEMLMNPT